MNTNIPNLNLIVRRTALAIGGCFALLTLPSRAQVINFDVPGGASGFTNYSGQGAYSDPGNNVWNAIVVNGTTSSGQYSNGTSSPITLTCSSDSLYTAGGQGTQGMPSGLQSPYLDAKPGPRTCTLNHVPNGTYDLYLYGINGDSADCNRGTIFTVGGASLSTVNTTASYNSFIQGNDYVVFSGLAVSGGTLSFSYQANTAVSGNTIGNFNGLQLVPVKAINFDVPGGASGFTNYSGQGAYSDPGHNVWNAIVSNGTTPAGLYSDGTSSPITLTCSSDSFYTAGGQGAQGTPSGLQSPFFDSKPGPKTCTLNHVPNGTYNLYLYGINGDSTTDCNRGTTFTVGSASSSTVNTNAAYNTFIDGNDYVVFTNVQVSTGSLSFTYQANTAVSGNAIGNFNGLQLVPAAGAPISVVNVDYGATERAANQIASGILHAVFPTEPARYLDDGIKFSNIRGSGTPNLPNGPDCFDPTTYQVVTQSGTAGTHLMIGPYYYQAGQGSTPYWPGDNGNQSTWANTITSLYNLAISGSISVWSWPTWNEPDIEWTGTDSAGQILTTAGFEQAHLAAYKTLKGLSSSARVQAPEASGFKDTWIESFLTFCKGNNCLPDVLSWHEYDRQSDGTTPNIAAHAQELYTWMQSNGITPMPMALTEYDGNNWSPQDAYHMGYDVGNTLMFIMYIENAVPYGMVAAVRADWYAGWSGNPNYKSALSNLADTTSSPQFVLPTGAWWLYNAYRDQTGQVVSSNSTVTPDIGAFATQDSAMKRSIILIGNQNKSSSDPVTVTLSNLNSANASYLVEGGKIHVRVDEIPTGSPVTAITNISEGDYPVTNNYAVLNLPNLGPEAAYKLTVTSGIGSAATTTYQAGSLTPIFSSGVTYSTITGRNGQANGAGLLASNATGQFIQYTINVPTPGVYKLDAWLKSWSDKAIIALYVNGQTAQNQGGPKDSYAASGGFYSTDFGNIDVPTAGNITLKFVVAAKNPSSSSYSMCFDSFILTALQ